MEQLPKLNPSDVTLTSDGRVIINNRDYASALLALAKKKGPGPLDVWNNCNCGKPIEGIEIIELDKVKSTTVFDIK